MMCSVDFRRLTRHSLLKETRRGHFGPRLNTPLSKSPTDMIYKVSISCDWRLIHTRGAHAKAFCHLFKHIHVHDMFVVVSVDL